MTETETKTKKAFELSDLLYSRKRDKTSADLKKSLLFLKLLKKLIL